MTLKSGLRLAAFLALVALVSVTGSTFRPGEWYAALTKPDWTPPNWLFPPVWAALYVMIAVVGWRMFEREGFSRAFTIWLIALALNCAWSVIMFGEHQIGLAAIDIVALWVAILAFIAATWRADRTSSLLFVPYLVWISYAAALNLEIYRLNPAA